MDFKTVKRVMPFLKQFSGPPTNGDIVCFKFWQLVIASGCPAECAYCFLQTQAPYRMGLYDLKGTIFNNLEEIVPEVKKWLLTTKRPSGVIIGENQDGLAFEQSYKTLLGVTPLELVAPLFADKVQNPHGHRLIVLSKFTDTRYFEALPCYGNHQIILSWSLSLPSISARYEKKTAPLAKRLSEAKRHRDNGVPIRFRLDALAPIDNWESEVDTIVDQINAAQPEMLTIGAMRASNVEALRAAAARNSRDVSVFDLVTGGKDPSHFKHRIDHDAQVAMFSRVHEKLDPSITLALCKEDESLWKEIGLTFSGCHCLNANNDTVAVSRFKSRAIPVLNFK